jgi:hypothetical protein
MEAAAETAASLLRMLLQYTCVQVYFHLPFSRFTAQNGPEIRRLQAVSSHFDARSFYPKLLSGLVFNSLKGN